ncbi:MAG: chemotaxis protein CheW [Betaproteobacteria bacterium]|nr:chemotaxis protein CheW [Betaproteobacteria bacterium]
MTDLVVFRLGELRIAVALAAVVRVVRVVCVTPLPEAPEIILGVINVQGRVVPMFDIRSRFGLRSRDAATTDQILIAWTNARQVGLIVDSVTGTLSVPQAAITASRSIVPGIRQVNGVLTLPDGLLLIHDLDGFLSLDEARELDLAMERNREGR